MDVLNGDGSPKSEDGAIKKKIPSLEGLGVGCLKTFI